MAVTIREPDKQKFAQSIITRMGSEKQTMSQIATKLNAYYENLDDRARRAFVNNAVRMYNNYENRWLGDVVEGKWRDEAPQGTNNAYFTVPLLTAHVDVHTTFYTKVRPKYVAKPFVDTHINRKVADMCQRIVTDELSRMLKPSLLQHEAQYIALATVSYRNIVMDYQKHSPVVLQDQDVTKEVHTGSYECADCGNEFIQEVPQPNPGEQPPTPQCSDGSCMSSNVTPGGINTESVTETQQVPVKLPRPCIQIPNPIAVQDDFSAATFQDSRFVITRRKISRKEAEYYYQIDLSAAFDSSRRESNAQHSLERQPVGPHDSHNGWGTFSFPEYVDYQNELVEEVRLWLEPCEYGLYVADGDLLQAQYPNGAFFHIVGDQLVTVRPSDKSIEWVRVQQGVRPASNKGMGMSHLADLNSGINDSISLEYSILRTHGFPLRLLRGKWLSKLPQANQTLVMDKITDDNKLSEAVFTEQPSNVSGTLGIITTRFQGYMQYIGGSLNPVGMPSDMKDMMGSATGASAVQEMMSDRMGLSIQMRVEADIETGYAVLELYKNDIRNKQYFIDGGYDNTTVEAFFRSDFRSLFYFEPAKGTDEPRMDSVNTFKVQSFASLTASLTGLHEQDPEAFRDIVSALGDTLNIDVSIGSGRKERNLADNRISAIIELYKSERDLPDMFGIDSVTFAARLFQAVTMKENLWMQSVIRSQIQPPPDGATEQDKMLLQAEAAKIAETIEVYLFDYDALVETYSDWLQSDAGQSADIAVSVAVGMLYAYCMDQKMRRKQIEQQQAMQMAIMTGQVTPPGVNETDARGNSKISKRDGSTGPGRPKDPHVDKQPED